MRARPAAAVAAAHGMVEWGHLDHRGDKTTGHTTKLASQQVLVLD